MHCAESDAEVLLIKGDRDILVDPVADISDHELLEGDRLEFNFVLDVFTLALERELFRAAVINEV